MILSFYVTLDFPTFTLSQEKNQGYFLLILYYHTHGFSGTVLTAVTAFCIDSKTFGLPVTSMLEAVTKGGSVGVGSSSSQCVPL